VQCVNNWLIYVALHQSLVQNPIRQNIFWIDVRRNLALLACEFAFPGFNPAIFLYWSKTMTNLKTTETELRHAVIDRLIAASLSDIAPAREATLQRWRTLGAKAEQNDSSIG
jgi:hypothetical protein